MVLNRCRSVLKGRYNQYKVSAIHSVENISDEYSDDLIIKAELINMLTIKIDKLPLEQRKVFDLLYLYQLTTNEISSILDISINTVRVQKMRLDREFKIFNKNRWWIGHKNRAGKNTYIY